MAASAVEMPFPMARQRSHSVGNSEDLHRLIRSGPQVLQRDRRRKSVDCPVSRLKPKKFRSSAGIKVQPKQIVHNLKTSGQDLNNKPKKVLHSLKKGSESVNRVRAVQTKRARRMFKDVATKASGAVANIISKRRKPEPVVMQLGRETSVTYAGSVAESGRSGHSVSIVHMVLLAAFFVVQMIMTSME